MECSDPVLPSEADASRSALLDMHDIDLSFGRIQILYGASFALRAGEIHALLGENGAGKSSLMKVLFGLYPMQRGRITLRGEPVRINHPRQALASGIVMIHQELPFAGHLSVAQNLFLGRELRRGPFATLVDHHAQNRQCRELLAAYPVSVSPEQPLRSLSIAQQQIVAIAKAIATGAGVIVLDESTTALTDHETEQLFALLRRLKAGGTSFILITHKIDEVFQICDRATVMRDGKTIATLSVSDSSPQHLVRDMVGREVGDLFPARTPRPGPVKLRVDGLTTAKVHDVSFEARAGEVLGIAGLMGAGRTELFNALFGLDPLVAGRVEVDGVDVEIDSPRTALARKFAYVTEDRKQSGLALDLGVPANITLASVDRFTTLGVLHRRALRALAGTYIDRLRIRAKTLRKVGLLSGGNQQKVVLARWLASGADVFLLDEPTRGIDVGTKHEIYTLINDLSTAGKTVLLVTSELPELLAMSDRFLVFAEGRLVRTLTKDEATPEKIVYYASSRAASRTPASTGPAPR